MDAQARAVYHDQSDHREPLFRAELSNAYSYVLNNPLALIDPSGFEPTPKEIVFPEVLILSSKEFHTGQAARYGGA